jgi:protoporphyrinogen oxidase
MKERGRIGILGGGVAGLVLANEIAKATGDYDIEILERNESAGGLQKSVEIDGMFFDVGTFIFHDGHNLLRSFPEIQPDFVQVRYSPITITPKWTKDRYPLSAKGFLRDHGWLSLLRAGLSLAICKVTCRKKQDLVAYIQYYIGREIYEKSGLKHYIERLYHLEDRKIDLNFALKRLGYLEWYGGIRKNIYRLSRKVHRRLQRKPLLRYFARSAKGWGYMYARICEALESRRVKLLLNARIDQIDKTSAGFRIRMGSEERVYDHLVSTIPLGTLAKLAGVDSCPPPRFLKLLSLFFTLDGEWKPDAEVLFNFTLEGEWKRITLFSGYYGKVSGLHYFTVEMTFNENDVPDWKAFVDKKSREFQEHFRRCDVAEGSLRHVGHYVLPNAYPLYTPDDLMRVDRIERALTAIGINLLGRQGQFLYETSDPIAGRAIKLAQRFAERAS